MRNIKLIVTYDGGRYQGWRLAAWRNTYPPRQAGRRLKPDPKRAGGSDGRAGALTLRPRHGAVRQLPLPEPAPLL